MSDIVERLRCHNRMASGSHYMDEAAAEIERLRADKARLREALEFARLELDHDEYEDGGCRKSCSACKAIKERWPDGGRPNIRAALEATR